MAWDIRYHPQADRDIDRLDPLIRRRVLAAIGALAQEPRAAANAKALKGSDRHRIRVGDWRVIYTLHDDVLLVLVLRVAHRREAYR